MPVDITQVSESNIKDDVSYDITNTEHSYTYIPDSYKMVRKPFAYLSDGLNKLSSYAKYNNNQNSLVGFERRLRWIFANTICKENIERVSDKPTSNQILGDFTRFKNSSEKIDPRTITITKTKVKDEMHIKLKYSTGFDAQDEIIKINQNENSEDKYNSIRFCSKGIKSVHAPYNPNIIESWRKNTESQFSLSYVETEAGLKIGIRSNRPTKPFYYKILSPILRSEPYAYDTLNLDNQTSVVNYLINEY